VSLEIRRLIREMSIASPLWGAPRIHGELLMLGDQHISGCQLSMRRARRSLLASSLNREVFSFTCSRNVLPSAPP
jgi:hypothetical protein